MNKKEDLQNYDDIVYVEQDEGQDAAGKRVITTGTGVHSVGFRDFLFKAPLQNSIVDSGFEHPSEVQQQALPTAILNQDLLAQAKSGMGKTAVFVLSILQQLDEENLKPNQALVLCHTRELAYQIKKEFDRFSKHMPSVITEVIYGGPPLLEHHKLLKGPKKPHVVVGTPGRILALVKSKHLNFENLKTFVLDECDKMLEQTDMRRDVQQIFFATPHKKQVMMFSATMNDEVKDVCRKFMRTPHEIFIDDDTKLTLHGLLQHFVKLEENEKIKKLIGLLDTLMFNQVIVFVKSVKYAEKLDEILRKENFPSVAVHSGLKQEERLKRYNEFKEFKKRIMVSTDVFGRGIDIEKINVVFNFDMPPEDNQYLHRVGRAGRFGTRGLAISFVSSQEDQKVLEDVQKRFEVKITEMPEFIDTKSYMNN